VVISTPRVFSRDTAGGLAGGDDLELAQIVQGPFSALSWGPARDQLKVYLGKRRESYAESRARFYLAQTYYFLKDPRQALPELLAIQNRYPQECAVWIQGCLAMMGERR
jgi:hypothetical protein